MADDKPPEKPTVELEKPPPWAIALTEKVVQGFTGVDARLDAMEANVEILKNDGQDTKARLIRIETWKDGVDLALTRHSGGVQELGGVVKQASSANLEQDAAIAKIIAEQAEAKKRDEAAQAALAKNTQLTEQGLGLLKTAGKNPAVLALILAAVTYATAWLGHHTP